MNTNSLTKGARVMMNYGEEAILQDSKRSNVRLAKLYLDFPELAYVYAHDIVSVQMQGDQWVNVELTPEQEKSRDTTGNIFFTPKEK